MRKLILLAVVVSFVALAAAPALCETWVYLDSAGDIFYVTTLTLPGTDIITKLDTCGTGDNVAPCTVDGYVSAALTVVKAVGKAALKLAAKVVHWVV